MPEITESACVLYMRMHCITVVIDIIMIMAVVYTTYQVLPHQARIDLGVMAIKGVLHIPQSSNITATSSSNSLVSYPEKQLVYSIVPADLAISMIGLIYLFITTFLHHHHHVVPSARISLTLSRHFSLLFIASGRSSGLHPVSSHSCCM